MEPKLQELLQTVTGKTTAGDLKWRAFSDESFRVELGSGHIHVSRGTTRVEDTDGNAYPARTYAAQVTDGQGRVVTEVDVTAGFGEGEFSLVAQLFDAARKSALKAEGVLDRMLDELRGHSVR